MTKIKEKPVRAVGYVRLSTERQAADDPDYQKQSETIRKACARRGFTLVTICGDVASGADPRGATRREELGDAVRRAHAESAVLVVSEPTRLFRNVDAAREFLKTLDIPVFSARVGRFLGRQALLQAIERGEATVHAIRKATSDALRKRRAEGVVFSDAAGRKKGAAKSAKVRGDKAQSIMMEVVGILERDQAYRDLSHQALADLLNRNRIKTGRGLAWTKNSVRHVRKKAEEHLQMIAEVESDDDEMHGCIAVENERAAWSAEASDFGCAPEDGVALQVEREPVPVASTQEQDDGEAEMKKLPTYGMF